MNFDVFFCLDFPLIWGFILGFILAAVSPAVVVPSLIALQERGLGVEQGIPSLIIAAASLDDICAILGFSLAFGQLNGLNLAGGSFKLHRGEAALRKHNPEKGKN